MKGRKRDAFCFGEITIESPDLYYYLQVFLEFASEVCSFFAAHLTTLIGLNCMSYKFNRNCWVKSLEQKTFCVNPRDGESGGRWSRE